MSNSSKGGLFPMTDWQRLAALRLATAEDKSALLGELYARYERPVRVFLSCKGWPQDDVHDLAQGFFEYAMEGSLFESADRDRGRFRDFVRVTLARYAVSKFREEHAQIRRPEGGFVSAEALAETAEDALGASGDDTPESAFERAWARALLGRVLTVMQAEFKEAKQQVHFEIFRRFVVAPILESAACPSQRELAADYWISEDQVGNRLVTARRAYKRLLRRELATYCRDEAEIDQEIGELFDILKGRG
jgi:RNA polymerase sigma-70 factor (ECF subfamily)